MATAQSASSPSQQNTESGCRSFVQSFYDWYVPIALREQSKKAWDIALRRKPRLFEHQLAVLIQSDSDAQRKAKELIGLDFDPFLNSQDPSEQFGVKSVDKKSYACLVTVDGFSSGIKREELVAEVRFTNDRWQFSNFYYADGENRHDLMGLLRRLAADRQSDTNASK